MVYQNGLSNFIRCLLLISLGVVGPLAYLDSHSPHDLPEQGYQFSLWQPSHTDQAVKILAALAQHHRVAAQLDNQWPDQFAFAFSPGLTNRSPVISLVSLLQNALSGAWIESENEVPVLYPGQFTRLVEKGFILRGVDLPKPTKPPQLAPIFL